MLLETGCPFHLSPSSANDPSSLMSRPIGFLLSFGRQVEGVAHRGVGNCVDDKNQHPASTRCFGRGSEGHEQLATPVHGLVIKYPRPVNIQYGAEGLNIH